MTFLAPAWLAVAGAAAAALIVMHFFARQRPRPAILPTARFVPDVAARAPSLASSPTDVLLLLARVLAIAAIGLALAHPVTAPSRKPVLRVIAVDPVVGPAVTGDSAHAWLQPGDTIVTLDTAARDAGLSAALIAALRAASVMRERADSFELVIVSPFVARSFDAATDSIRRLWPGRARLVRVASRDTSAPPRIVVAGPGDDPLRATVALMGARRGADVRLLRATPGAPDSAAARAGTVVVHWPVRPAATWPASRTDTIGGVTAGVAVVVAPFERGATLPAVEDARTVARWIDGTAAALEHPLGAGCMRDVAIPIAETGDLALRRSVRDLVDALTAPCAGRTGSAVLPDERIASLRGGGALLPARLAPRGAARPSPAASWLFGLAALLLLGEMLLRPRVRPA